MDSEKNMSTSDAILNINQYIYIYIYIYFVYVYIYIYIYMYDNLDKGYSVVSRLLDFSKAFDCVNHETLLHKLRV